MNLLTGPECVNSGLATLATGTVAEVFLSGVDATAVVLDTPSGRVSCVARGAVGRSLLHACEGDLIQVLGVPVAAPGPAGAPTLCLVVERWFRLAGREAPRAWRWWSWLLGCWRRPGRGGCGR